MRTTDHRLPWLTLWAVSMMFLSGAFSPEPVQGVVARIQTILFPAE